MKILIVHAHPEPKSFLGQMASAAVAYLEGQGHEVALSDLYAMNFDAVGGTHDFGHETNPDYFNYLDEQLKASTQESFSPEILAEQEKLLWCDALILQFPLWWHGMPAILKGWIDRVFARGFAYGGGRWYDTGPFVGKRAMLSLTVGGLETSYSAQGIQGDLNTILLPIHRGVLQYVGFEVVPPFVAFGEAYVDDAGKTATLERFESRLAGLFSDPPYPPVKLADYDASLQLEE